MQNTILLADNLLFHGGGPYDIETNPLISRNQSIDLLCKSMDWFLYDRDSVMKELMFELINLIIDFIG